MDLFLIKIDNLSRQKNVGTCCAKWRLKLRWSTRDSSGSVLGF